MRFVVYLGTVKTVPYRHEIGHTSLDFAYFILKGEDDMPVKIYSRKNDGSKSLSKNFTVGEFACKDGTDQVRIDTKLVEYLQSIRDKWGKPITITSGYRTVSYNAKIGGASGSYHTTGQAADIVISGVKPIDIAKYAEGIGVLGIGCYNDDLFNHIDTRTSKFFWYNQTVTATSTFGGGSTPSGDTQIKQIQSTLNRLYGASLYADGVFGAKTLAAIIKGIQTELNLQFKAGLTVDGKWGAKTKARCVTLKLGDSGNLTLLLQSLLYVSGYKIAVDGSFGNSTLNAVKSYQKAAGIAADGLAGGNTFEKLVR